MYDEITEDQRSRLPSETDEYDTTQNPSYEQYVSEQITCQLDPDSEEDWKKLSQKAMGVYERGLNDGVDFKHQKSTADTVMEIVGKRGNNRKGGSADGNQFFLPPETMKAMIEGLAKIAAPPQKEVDHEEFKLSPRGSKT